LLYRNEVHVVLAMPFMLQEMPSRPQHLVSVTVFCGRLCGQTFVLSLCCRFVSRLFLCQTFVCFIIMSFYVVVLYPDCNFMGPLFYIHVVALFLYQAVVCFIFVVDLYPDCNFVRPLFLLSLLWFCVQIVPLSDLSSFYLCCNFVRPFFVLSLL